MTDIVFTQPDHERLELPSNGVGHGIKSLMVRPMTMKEERILTNKTLAKSGEAHREIFKSCVGAALGPDGNEVEFDLDSLYLEDEFALLLFLRAISYGMDYDTEIVCDECKKKYDITLNLETDLPVKYAPEGLSPTVTVDLPISKHKVTLKYPTIEASREADNVIDMIPHLVVKVDKIDSAAVPIWLTSLIGRDISVMRKAVEAPFGVNKKVKFVCTNDKCDDAGVQQEVELPITAEFFRI